MTSGKTAICGILGWPVAHSLSPAMHNAAFAALGIDWQYVPFPTGPNDLATAIDGARALGVRGVNITIPHKVAALALCSPDALARRVGAVNTLRFEAEQIVGTNTDVHGFATALDELGAAPKHAIVLGYGGAARAVVEVLSTRQIPMTLVGRKEATMHFAGNALPVVPRETITTAMIAACDLLVDATPRGLTGEPPWIDPAALAPDAAVLDLVVGVSTPIVAAARAAGRRAATGTRMLLHQGVAAFMFWTGLPAPIEVMAHALDVALAS